MAGLISNAKRIGTQADQKKKKKKKGILCDVRAARNVFYSEFLWKEMQALKRGENEKMNPLFVTNWPENMLLVSICQTLVIKIKTHNPDDGRVD